MPLVIRRASISRPSSDDYDIVSGELALGRVYRVEIARGETAWRWHLRAISGPATEVRTSGHEPDLDTAKAAIAANWRKWLELAGLSENDGQQAQP
jgi:hypothetical protein